MASAFLPLKPPNKVNPRIPPVHATILGFGISSRMVGPLAVILLGEFRGKAAEVGRNWYGVASRRPHQAEGSGEVLASLHCSWHVLLLLG